MANTKRKKKPEPNQIFNSIRKPTVGRGDTFKTDKGKLPRKAKHKKPIDTKGDE